MTPSDIANLVMAAIVTIGAAAALLAMTWLAASSFFDDYAEDLKNWRKGKKALEAERIIGFAKPYSDTWAAEMEAKLQAHEVRKPDLPWPLGGH